MIDWGSFSILVGLFLVLIMLGVPIAFGMIASGLLFAVTFSGGVPLVIPQRLINGIDSFVLLAVPFFVLVGQLMNTGGITTRIFNFCHVLVGHVKGGLAYVDILSSVVFAGMSGSAVADASGLGAVVHKTMIKRGYPVAWAASVTASSATFGPLIPPSIPFVIYASMTNLSVGKLLLAGLLPGLLCAFLLTAYVYILGKAKVMDYPEITSKGPGWGALGKATLEALPALLTPAILIGGIAGGLFTPTEAAAVGCVYSIVLGMAVYRELTMDQLWKAVVSSAKLSAQILFIVAAASYFGNALAIAQVPQVVFAIFVDMASTWNPAVVLIVLNIVLLIVGMFLEGTAILIILVPILAPLGGILGVDDIHLAVIIVFNVMIGLITPPVGMLLFVMTEISTAKFDQIAKAVLPFVGILLFGLMIVTFVPWLSTGIPEAVFGSG